MQTPSNFKHDFLKHLLSGLHAARESSRGVSLIEREKQIKLLADAAMALARGHGANWSRAIIAGMLKQKKDEAFVAKKLYKGSETSVSPTGSHGRKKIMKKKSFNARLKVRKKGFHSPSSWKVMPSVLARRIVKKRTQVLKRIIPGAESLDVGLIVKRSRFAV
ncbi:uncharacterized protein LOC110019129 isoform X2 [Phalaenopsis equestris]|uniref:uncharacterized protein LOC110019129 isoform X2 n=1 Tax=Phalaenopsis equestris TaxID=78828 RepID=UPI0009E297D9|nr:uncharacterized protein LOC110019129 isoform X2 [Phalaenopsis equestris]